MEDFIWRLAVAVIPLFLLVGSVTLITALSEYYAHRPLAWHRKRRAILRALSAGVIMR